MFRSSTSSSERPRRRWQRVVVLALLVVMLMEVVLRLPQAEAVLGGADLFYHPGVDERLDALERTRSKHDRIDVLFVGSSVVRTNLSPLVFDAELASRGAELVSFNGGLSAMRIDPTRLYIENLWLPRARPRMIVQAVRYEDLLNSPPAAEFAPFEHGRYEQLWTSESPLAAVQLFAVEHSRLVQYAGLLTRILVSPETARVADGFAIDERGFNSTERLLSDARQQYAVEDIPGGVAAERGYAAPLSPDTFSVAFSMLIDTITTVREADVDYVLVNMPEHGDKFVPHPDGAERYELYLAELRAFADRLDVPFIDLAGGDLSGFRNDADFADFNHMSPDAAAALSRLLAARFVEERLVDRLADSRLPASAGK